MSLIDLFTNLYIDRRRCRHYKLTNTINVSCPLCTLLSHLLHSRSLARMDRWNKQISNFDFLYKIFKSTGTFWVCQLHKFIYIFSVHGNSQAIFTGNRNWAYWIPYAWNVDLTSSCLYVITNNEIEHDFDAREGWIGRGFMKKQIFLDVHILLSFLPPFLSCFFLLPLYPPTSYTLVFSPSLPSNFCVSAWSPGMSEFSSLVALYQQATDLKTGMRCT